MQKLAKYLSHAGLSQTEFALLIDVNQSTVNRLVRGEIKDPVISVVLAIQRVTGGKIKPEDWATK